MRVWKAHMEFRSVLISHPYCFLREALSLGSELTNSARLASQWALRSACFLPQPWDYTPGHHGFLHRCWESNVSPHAYTASFLPTPQVLALDLNSLIQSSILNLIAGNTSLAEKKGKTTTKKAFEKCVCLTWQERNTTPMQQYPFPQLVGRCDFYTVFLIRFSFSMLAPFSQTFGWGISCLVEWQRVWASMIFTLKFLLLDTAGLQGPLWFPWLSCQLFSSLVKFHWRQNVLSSSSWSLRKPHWPVGDDCCQVHLNIAVFCWWETSLKLSYPQLSPGAKKQLFQRSLRGYSWCHPLHSFRPA